jgi:hypothetical protein
MKVETAPADQNNRVTPNRAKQQQKKTNKRQSNA